MHGREPTCGDEPLRGDRRLHVLCEPRGGDGQQLRNAWQRGDDDRVWTLTISLICKIAHSVYR